MSQTRNALGIPYSVHIESQGSHPNKKILCITPGRQSSAKISPAESQLKYAAEWALNLDGQYRHLLETGNKVHIQITVGKKIPAAQVSRETVDDYRNFRLKVSDLIHPLLLDQPKLEALYPFQIQGVQWLLNQPRGILADDMGLGKTVQVISAMRLLFNRAKIRSSLVVCPKNLIANWEHEFNQWAPELGVAIVTPPAHIRENAWKVLIGYRHVLLTNYEQFRELPNILRTSTPDLIIADEAHRLRNRETQVSSGSTRLNSTRFWALTGTPIERDIKDLATLLSLVAPGHFSPSDSKMHPASLKSRARPYILRRRKHDVLKDLPAVRDITEMLDLTNGQKLAYANALKQRYTVRGREAKLALLTELQTICDFDSESNGSCKITRVIELLEKITQKHEKAVLFSYRLNPLRVLKHKILSRWGHDAATLLVGEMKSNERVQAVESFRNSERTFVLLASSRIGAEGLTLVEANHVILFNQWWNPSSNEQARDRVVRIGQRRNVCVYRFCCRGTIEESLAQVLKSKKELFDHVVENMATRGQDIWLHCLSDTEVDEILSSDSEDFLQ